MKAQGNQLSFDPHFRIGDRVAFRDWGRTVVAPVKETYRCRRTGNQTLVVEVESGAWLAVYAKCCVSADFDARQLPVWTAGSGLGA